MTTDIILTVRIIQLALGLVAALAWAVWGRKPSLCDSCRHLRRKGGDVWRYHCQKQYGGFDRAPSICADYEERKK